MLKMQLELSCPLESNQGLAAMHQITNGTKADPQDLVGTLTADLGDHTDTAGIVFVCRIIERSAALMVGQGMIHEIRSAGGGVLESPKRVEPHNVRRASLPSQANGVPNEEKFS